MISGFWETVKNVITISALAQAAVLIALLILLALPQSDLRRLVLRVISTLSTLTTMAMLVYVVSPLDIIPDGIPAAGTVDDVFALLFGLGSGATGLIADVASRRPITFRQIFGRHRM